MSKGGSRTPLSNDWSRTLGCVGVPCVWHTSVSLWDVNGAAATLLSSWVGDRWHWRHGSRHPATAPPNETNVPDKKPGVEKTMVPGVIDQGMWQTNQFPRLCVVFFYFIYLISFLYVSRQPKAFRWVIAFSRLLSPSISRVENILTICLWKWSITLEKLYFYLIFQARDTGANKSLRNLLFQLNQAGINDCRRGGGRERSKGSQPSWINSNVIVYQSWREEHWSNPATEWDEQHSKPRLQACNPKPIFSPFFGWDELLMCWEQRRFVGLYVCLKRHSFACLSTLSVLYTPKVSMQSISHNEVG